MIDSDFHIHSDFCDGRDSIENMIESAIDKNIINVGISSHFPLKYQNDWTMSKDKLSDYFQLLNFFKAQYKTRCNLNCGTEMDFYLDTMDFSNEGKKYFSQFDYIIGSIHTMGGYSDGTCEDIDGSMESFSLGLKVFYENNIKKLVKKYYEGITQMVSKYQPSIIGHFDIIKKNNINNYFYDPNEKWYIEIWKTCLHDIKNYDSVIEINTGGIARYGEAFLYPARDILKTIYELSIPITINSDAHIAKNIAFAFDETIESLKSIGFKDYYVLENKTWTSRLL